MIVDIKILLIDMEKLSSLRLKLDVECAQISYRQGSLFHGAIMEILNSEYADELHQSQLHPYSQYLESDSNGYVYWVVNCTNRKASDNILSPLLKLDSVFIKKLNREIRFVDKTYRENEYQKLTGSFYNERASRYIDLKIKSPLSFKKNDEYTIFPDLRNFYKSLMNKYDEAMKESDSSMFDLSTLDELCEKTRIIRYNLRSCGFPLEGVMIPSFWGSMSLKISGAQTLINFAHMLFRFGEYSGIGIKTSMGMGAVAVIENNGGVKNEND